MQSVVLLFAILNQFFFLMKFASYLTALISQGTIALCLNLKRLAAYVFVEILCSVDKYVTPKLPVNTIARHDRAQVNAPPDSASCNQTASSFRLSFHNFLHKTRDSVKCLVL